MTTDTVAQHTPGPWRIDPNDESTWRILGPLEERDYRNEIGELAYTGGNAEANARLIAAAPDLLAALEAVNDNLTTLWGDPVARNQPMIMTVRAAITKARGV